ncbi:class I SAM-dependent methyltransferase [Solirubrobacter pauli]|uniref:class I SAM-dependent methyltransferase n=1 Tax=Solirubrobacter pauli TaxID=166793 RepID=UPI001FED2627|nr:class I SAM-dependent methyltransferase [Solirubrobacter pauli]
MDLPHPRFARLYPRAAARADARGAASHRSRLVADLSGRVVEIGAGHGANFVHYPPTVTEVVAIEPEPTLRALATQAAAAHMPVPISVRPGTAEALPFADHELDAAVVSLVLCSVPDQARALDEIRRVLKPGGELRFYEHVIPRGGVKRMLLQAADRSGAWPALAGGCHPARDTAAAIERAGFTIEACERIDFSAAAIEPTIPYLLGRARSGLVGPW